MEQKQVIVVTDGDAAALKTIQYVANKIGGLCIAQSAGNPTHLTGQELIELILQADKNPCVDVFYRYLAVVNDLDSR